MRQALHDNASSLGFVASQLRSLIVVFRPRKKLKTSVPNWLSLKMAIKRLALFGRSSMLRRTWTWLQLSDKSYRTKKESRTLLSWMHNVPEITVNEWFFLEMISSDVFFCHAHQSRTVTFFFDFFSLISGSSKAIIHDSVFNMIVGHHNEKKL